MDSSRFHHTGFVVPSIEECQANLAELIGARSISAPVIDPIQQVKVAFLSQGVPGAGQIELVEPMGDKSPVLALAHRGGGLHHVCYEVDDLEQQLRRSKLARAVLVRAPQPAAAFSGRRIAWVMTRHRLLVEYLERGGQENR